MQMMTVRDILKEGGGPAKVSKEINAPVRTVTAWGLRGRVPARWVMPVSKATKVPPHVIRPDVFPAPATAR